MARQQNKSELLNHAKAKYERLIEFVDSFSKKEQSNNFSIGAIHGNIKDVLAHLHAWHLMQLDWYTQEISGEKHEIPFDGFSKNLPDFNQDIQKRYAQVSLDKTKGLLAQSYKTILKIIEMHGDNEFFAKKSNHWMGATSLSAYLISTIYSHYDWAYHLIEQAKKEEITE